MARKVICAAAAAAILAAAAPALAETPDHLTPTQLQWQTMIPGVGFAPAYGDWEKGAHGKYVRFDPGTVVPMHTHTNDYHGAMISGQMVNLYDGGQRVDINSGDYWYVAATRPHGHECVSKEPCFFYTYGDALWDIQLVEAE